MTISRGLIELKDLDEVKTLGDRIYENLVGIFKMFWQLNMFFWLWFNMLTIPFIMLWPDLSNAIENYELWLILWLNELMWLSDMIFKCFIKKNENPNQDQYDNAVAYMKSAFIIDLIAFIPSTLSGLNPCLVVFKFVRLHQTELLYYPLKAIIHLFCFYRES